MNSPWVRAKTKPGKNAIKAALLEECYIDSLDYDALVDFAGFPDDIIIDSIRSRIKDIQADFIKSLEPKKKETRGRKNRGLTALHYEEDKRKKREDYNNFMHTPNAAGFIYERVQGEIINDDDINQFTELYKTTCESILEEYKQNNPNLVKKHPYQWFKPLLLQIKRNVPKITAFDIDKCIAVWDCLADLLYSIGLYPTFELFQYMTNIYKYQLENKKDLSPKYAEFLKKITIDSDNALITELATSPYNSTNKIFLAKVHGIIEKTEPKQIEVHHDIRNYNTLPMFGDGEN